MATENEKLCKGCNEFWPADSQFWFRDARHKDKLSYTCKACCYENGLAGDYRSKKQEPAVGRLTDVLANILMPLPCAAVAL